MWCGTNQQDAAGRGRFQAPTEMCHCCERKLSSKRICVINIQSLKEASTAIGIPGEIPMTDVRFRKSTAEGDRALGLE